MIVSRVACDALSSRTKRASQATRLTNTHSRGETRAPASITSITSDQKPSSAHRATSRGRVPFGPPRPPHRSYRVGRFSTTPIRLRIVGDDEMIQLTTVVWDSWPALVRVLLTLPDVQSDSRTRGRLDRYG